MRKNLLKAFSAVLLITCAFISTVILTSCDKGDKCVTPKGGGEVSLKSDGNANKQIIKLYADGEDYMESLAKAFEAKNPTYIVQYTHVGSVDSRKKIELEGKKGADVFVTPHDHIGAALLSNILDYAPASLKTIMDDTLTESTVKTIASCWDSTNNKSKTCEAGDTEEYFGAPISAETIAMFYSKSLVQEAFTAAGMTAEAAELETKTLDEVVTFNELMAVGKTYNDFQNKKVFFLIDIDDFYHSYMFMSAFGFQLFGPNGDDPDQANFNTQPVIDGLNWVKDNYYSNLTPDDVAKPKAADLASGTYNDLFYDNKVPVLSCGPWCLASALDGAVNDTEGNFVVTKFPQMEIADGEGTKLVNPTSFSGVQVAAVNKSSENKQAAWKLVEFMISNEGAGIIYDSVGKLPCLSDLSEAGNAANDPYLKGISKQLAYANAMPSISEVGYIWTRGENMFKGLFEGTAAAGLAKQAQDDYEGLYNK